MFILHMDSSWSAWSVAVAVTTKQIAMFIFVYPARKTEQGSIANCTLN